MKKTFYRICGVNYDAIIDCSADTKAKYANLGFALFLTCVLAFIGGFDVAHQFSPNPYVCSAIGLLWATAVFSFDYFMINGGKSSKPLLFVRMIVGAANIIITMTALFIMLNQSTIDTKLRLENAGKVSSIDSTYLKSKEARFSAYNKQLIDMAKYHKETCLPEAQNGFPGPKYDKNHSVCITADTLLKRQLVRLNSEETPYFNAYQSDKSAKESVTTNDFFTKAIEVPKVLTKNWFVTFLAGCLFIFLGYIELQAISIKFGMDKNDEYQKALLIYNVNKSQQAERFLKDRIADDNINYEHKQKIKELEQLDREAKLVDDLVISEYKLSMKESILGKKGYRNSKAVIKKLRQKHSKISNNEPKGEELDSIRAATDFDIFSITRAMKNKVDEIKGIKNEFSFDENLFNWVLKKIQYDTKHTKDFYRTARETYNEKKGLCGELSVLLMTFYRYAGIKCQFIEVFIDNTGKSVAHACLVIEKQDGAFQMVDVAYKSFNLLPLHENYKFISDEELKMKYQNWNI